jgi:molybdopterin-dependent oxidoreductase alpha subunit
MKKPPPSPQIEPPHEEHAPKLTEQKRSAGGIPAVLSAMRHVYSETNLLRGTQTLLGLNQVNGFDCPGCAWPDPDDKRSMTEFCENGAKAIAEEATQKTVTPEFFQIHSISKISLLSDYEIGKLGRITHPMMKLPNEDHYQVVSWDRAFSEIASQLNSLDSPDEATFYTSGRTSNEAAFLYQLFVRLYGTNNLPDCSNMCHESSGTAMTESLGIGKGSVTLEDFNHADCILVIGQNPGTNHPRMLTTLQEAARRGCKIISINPLKEAGVTRFKHPQEVSGILGRGTLLCSQFLQVRINGDVALLKGILKELLAEERKNPGRVFDHAFIQKYTEGYEEFIAELDRTSWELILSESQISREEIKQVAETLLLSKRLIICWAMGLTQHQNGVASIQEALHLLLLGGHLGRPGAGACPVRGHSNVQGDRTMGIWEKMPEAFLDRLGLEFNFSPPRHHGLDTVDSIRAMIDGRVRVFFGMGGNFLSATPDTHAVAEGLRKCQMTVHVSTKLNRSHLITGNMAFILPCRGRTEIDLQNQIPQQITVEDSMGVIHLSQGILKPISPELKSEVAIICGLAERVFGSSPTKQSKVTWHKMSSHYDEIRETISRVIPGFEDFNQRIHTKKFFHLPHPVRDRLEFRTPSGKARFVSHRLTQTDLPDGRYLLMTLRSHDQFNTTIYGLDDRYRGISKGRRVVFMNPEDMNAELLKSGALVHLTSYFGDQTRIVENFRIVPYSIPRKCLAAYFPEANPLVPLGSTAEKSNTPTYKSIKVSVRPA